jgi:hypothetical protein
VTSPEERVKLTLHEVETRIKNLNYEKGVIIGRNGDVVFEVTGDENCFFPHPIRLRVTFSRITIRVDIVASLLMT